MENNNETQVLESYQSIPLDKFATKEIVIEKTDEEIANDILNKRITFEDIARTPDWKKEVFFSKWEDANPGLTQFEVGEQPRTEQERQLIEQKDELNKFLASAKSPWRANCYHYGDIGSGIMLRTKIGQRGEDQGLYMYQEISQIRKFRVEIEGEGTREGYQWNADTFNFHSEKTDEFVKLDKLINTGKSSRAKRTVQEAKGARLREIHAIGNSLVAPNIREMKDILILFHELGHAQLNTLYTRKEYSLKNKARRIFDKGIEEKTNYEKNKKPGELSLGTAHKLIVADERRASAFALKLLKEIYENTNIEFGCPKDRNMFKKYIEDGLRAYDLRPMPLSTLESNRIPAFSQEQRGAARILEDKIKKGEIKREKAFGTSVDPKTRQYKGANIPSIYQ